MQDKVKEIVKEKTTWTIGIPAVVFGVLSILKDDNAQAVQETIQTAGQAYSQSGDWATGIGWLVAGLAGIFMKSR